jgi:hypothetical protein
MILLALLISPISAAKGSLTFVHGVNKSKLLTYASINSTAIERPLGIEGLVYIYDGELDGGFYYVPYVYKTNVNNFKVEAYVGRSEGESYFFYYCDHILRHESTKWWCFDFR